MKIVTHSACHASAAACGHSPAWLAACPTIANGDDSGNSSATSASVLPGRAAAEEASANIPTWMMVIGSDSIWISRGVAA